MKEWFLDELRYTVDWAYCGLRRLGRDTAELVRRDFSGVWDDFTWKDVLGVVLGVPVVYFTVLVWSFWC